MRARAQTGIPCPSRINRLDPYIPMRPQEAALTDIEPQRQVTADNDGEGLRDNTSASAPDDSRLGAASFWRLFALFTPFNRSTRSPHTIVLCSASSAILHSVRLSNCKMLACRSGAHSRPIGQRSSRATPHHTALTAAPSPLRRAVQPTRAQQADEPQPPPPQQPATAASSPKPPPLSPQSVVEEGSTGGLAKGQGTAIVTGAISLIFGFAYLVSVL